MLKIKNYLLYILLAFFVISSISITIAYFYQNYKLPNEFKTMTYNVDITEEFNNDWGIKKVYISNNETSSTNVVLRVKYVEMWNKIIDNEKYVLSNSVNGINVVNKNWTDTFLNDFVDGLDGWYYYKKILKPHDSIQLLESISLNHSITNSYSDYLDFDYNLVFSYEALEDDISLISNIWNTNVVISDDNVIWEDL